MQHLIARASFCAFLPLSSDLLTLPRAAHGSSDGFTAARPHSCNTLTYRDALRWTAPLIVIAAALLGGTELRAQTAIRVSRSLDNAKMSPLPNHVPAWANPNNDKGPVPADTIVAPLTIVLSRSTAQEHALEALLTAQQDPASPEYHHWLTPTEMGERFGLSEQDIDSISGWLQSQDLHVKWVSPSRTFIGFDGTAAAVGRAFRTELHVYNVNGAQRLSVSSDPMVPEALAPVIKAVRGLYTIEEQPLHYAGSAQSSSPAVTASDGSHYLAPADFATIYDIPGSLTGSGVTIAIVGRSRTDFADFDNFRSKTGSTFANPTEIIPTAFGGVDPGPAFTSPPAKGVSVEDQLEATLDVMRAGSVAPGANLLLVVDTTNGGNIGADAQYLIQTSPVPAQIMNISFGACESQAGPANVNFWDVLFKQAAAEGISVFVASGDAGASGCDAYFTAPPANPSPNSINYICSSSYATCVGGTEFSDASNPSLYWSSTNGSGFSSALRYIPEGAWNEPLNASMKPQTSATGGGVSTIIATPVWQTGAGVPAARSGRYTPDISFSASGHDGYFGCFAAWGYGCVDNVDGSFSFVYFAGTSAAAPDMAGVTALLDEKLGAAQGNLNPGLYQTAASSPAAFHDVTVSSSGVTACNVNTPSMCNNSIPGTIGLSGGQAGFSVAAGYDEATGLGSLDVNAFLSAYTFSSTPAGLQFIPVTPCRVADTRIGGGQFGAPAMAAKETRSFAIPQSACSIPTAAVAYSLNVTVVPNATLGFLTLWPAGQSLPNVSTLNSDGRIKANAAIVPAGTNGAVSVFVSDATNVILDINGYFVPAGTAAALGFYPLTPCRVVDTRIGTGPLAGPLLRANVGRDFPLLSGGCNLPSNATAYALNVTVVPRGPLNYLTTWPSGTTIPNVSTLNAPTGAITANAAIVPAAGNGDIAVFATTDTDLILDVNGYFAAPGGSGSLSLYPVTPCRVIDTRLGPGPLSQTTPISVEGSACAPPSTAEAYVLNATVVPVGSLNHLTLWPAGQSQPNVSTLNALDGATSSNMAIVPTNNGVIDVFPSDPTNVILDLSSYFAP